MHFYDVFRLPDTDSETNSETESETDSDSYGYNSNMENYFH